MKENKIGMIVCFIITIISGLTPIIYTQSIILSNYMLAIFGSSILSFSICIINYFVLKRKLIFEILHDDFYLNYQSKIQIELALGNNSLCKSQLIKFCSETREVIAKSIDKVSILSNGLFLYKSKGKIIINNYIEVLKKIFNEYLEMYIFLTLSNPEDIKKVSMELSNHLYNLLVSQEIVTYKDKIEQYFLKKKNNTDFSDDDFIKKYKDKITNTEVNNH